MELLESGRIQVEPLTYIRGRSLPHQYLIVDEAQILDVAGLEQLRALNRDGDGLAIVICGNVGILSKLEGLSKSNAQLYSRVGGRKVFHGATAEDINTLLSAWGVEDAAEDRFLRAIAATTCLVFLSLTTPAADLLAGLRRLGLPAELVEIALLTYRFIFLIGESAIAMTHAQAARLGHATNRLWSRSRSPIFLS